MAGTPVPRRTHVAVDVRARATPIDRRIYGHFLEEIGRLVDGGLFPEDGSSAPTTGIGYRRDVWEAARDLRPTLLRWPGGCYADVYHWREHVGPNRPHRPPNRYWGHRFGLRWGPPVHEELGTDEYLALCRDWHAAPYLTANMGTGTPEEAAAWVRHVNRRDDGLPRCDLWSLGNEQFGVWEVGHRTARGYARRALRFREAMRAEDATIQTVLNGAGTEALGWNDRVLEVAAEAADLLSVHLYLPQDYRLRWALGRPSDGLREWYAALSVAATVHAKLDRLDERVQRAAGRRIPFAIDEWNLWWDVRQAVQPRACLRDSLAAATLLMGFQRRAELVHVANLSSLINVIASPLETNRDHCARTSLYEVFRLFGAYGRGAHLPASVRGPCYASARVKGIRATEGTPFVAASATLGAEQLGDARALASECAAPRRRTVATFLVNRHHELDLPIELEYRGASVRADATLAWLTGPSRTAENRPGAPEQIVRGERVLPAAEAQELVLPARSLTVVVQPLD